MNTFVNILIACGLLLATQWASAQESTKTFDVVSGTVKVTQARCVTGVCKPEIYNITGTFAANLSKGAVEFPESTLTLLPEYEFELPIYPQMDENGITRKLHYTHKKNHLMLQGSEDKRAFDGPLIEYQLVARSIAESADFDSFHFYSARQDFRKCAAPLCGGYFVKAVNVPLTRCADGKLRVECYVAEIAFGESGLQGSNAPLNSNPYLVQGKITAKKYPNGSRLGYFSADKAYRALGSTSASGIFAGVQNNGIMCITSPCFSYDQLLLNSKRERRLSGLNTDALTEQNVDLQLMWDTLGVGDVVIATGKNQQTQEMAGTGISFVVNNVYVPIQPK